jgi:membrane glycosyltransferase
MQHIRLAFSTDMPAISRLHLGMGAMSYLSSPLWLLFLVLSFVWAVRNQSAGGTNPWWAAGLFVATMSMLMLPKLWSYILLICNRPRLAKCGGATKAAVSVLIETLISVFVAPVMMAFHTTFVVFTFIGRRVSWVAQPRDEQGQSLTAAVATHWQQTAAGVLAASLVLGFAPAMFIWLVPVLAGLVFSIPLSVWLSSVTAGQALARHGLLLTPEETSAPQVLQRHRHLLALPPPKELVDFRGMFRRILADPALLDLHRCILQAGDDRRHAADCPGQKAIVGRWSVPRLGRESPGHLVRPRGPARFAPLRLDVDP